ncbi:MAG: hypothetical protein GX823_06830, partial [Clostridiales bacterium]|nr:hypothetical protein [Clostridiales bacterium]
LYRGDLAPSGEICFKTDNCELFEYSLKRFKVCGFDVCDVTRDLHGARAALDEPNTGEKAIMTNYEERFHALGTKINRCVAAPRGISPEERK